MLTVDTVTRRRKVVSTREHLLIASHRKIELPIGRRIPARAQSTRAWWNIKPWLHLQQFFFFLFKIFILSYLLSGLLIRIIKIRARLAITPILPRLVRITADIFWS